MQGGVPTASSLRVNIDLRRPQAHSWALQKTDRSFTGGSTEQSARRNGSLKTAFLKGQDKPTREGGARTRTFLVVSDVV